MNLPDPACPATVHGSRCQAALESHHSFVEAAQLWIHGIAQRVQDIDVVGVQLQSPLVGIGRFGQIVEALISLSETEPASDEAGVEIDGLVGLCNRAWARPLISRLGDIDLVSRLFRPIHLAIEKVNPKLLRQLRERVQRGSGESLETEFASLELDSNSLLRSIC